MKTDLRYQNGSLYQHHGAWYVRYRQRISKEDGSCNLNHASKHLGRSKDFRYISDVELCRAPFICSLLFSKCSAKNYRLSLILTWQYQHSFRGCQPSSKIPHQTESTQARF